LNIISELTDYLQTSPSRRAKKDSSSEEVTSGCQLPYGITHCYLPPDTSECDPVPCRHLYLRISLM